MIYKPEIDGLRAISILLVIISHAGFGHVIPGGLGVTVFFVISGYLITSLLIHESLELGSVSLYRFFMRRCWRLLPPLFVFIIISVLVIYFVNHYVSPVEVFSAVFYLANYFKIFGHYTMLEGFPSPFNILWSLAIEEHFYLVFAPLFYFTYRSYTYFKVVVIMLALPFLIRLAVLSLFPELLVDGGYAYSATETRLDSIATGCLIAILFSNVRPYERWTEALKQSWVVYLGLAVLLCSLTIRNPFFRETIRYSVQNIALFLIMSYVIFSGHTLAKICRSILSQGHVVWIGKLSYSLYLYHWLAYVLTHLYVGREKMTFSWQISYWSMSVLLAVSSYLLIEQNTRKFRASYGSKMSI